MDNDKSPFNLSFIPFLASAISFLCNIVTLFAEHGHRVTVVTTPSYTQILPKSSPSLLLHVDFPAQEVAFSDGVQLMSAANDVEKVRKFYHASMLLRVPISRFREQHPHDCVVADFLYPWVHDVANNLRIPRLAYNGFSLFTVAAMETLRSNPALVFYADTFLIPHFPHYITLCSKPPKGITVFMERLLETKTKSDDKWIQRFDYNLETI